MRCGSARVAFCVFSLQNGYTTDERVTIVLVKERMGSDKNATF